MIREPGGSVRIPTVDYERACLADGYAFVVGCDEVGRGCLAGPVVAAAVIMQWDDVSLKERAAWCTLIRDSKMLSRAQRKEADMFVRQHALRFAVGEVASDVIDAINIHEATLRAMRTAVEQIVPSTEGVFGLVDGRFIIPKLSLAQRAVINGDADVFSIAAASVVAKEYRDQLMERLGEEYPVYGFAQHKGYGTKQHRAALVEHGLSPVHRKTFCHL